MQRQLGIGCHQTAWATLHKLRGAMVAPARELLKHEVEIDEFYLGGYEEGLKGSRQRGKKVLVGVVIEVRGRGSGRLRLRVLPDPSSRSLLALTKTTTAPGAIVHTDGYQAYNVLTNHGYDHRRRPKQSAAPGEHLLPRAHRAISNLKASMHGTHRGVSPEHLPVYLDEFVLPATTAAALPWPASKRCSGSGLPTSHSPIAQFSTEPPDTYLEPTRYALVGLPG